MSALRAVEVEVVYGDGTRALAGVSLAVADGETVVLVGESGSGKSTLLKCFNRLVTPTSGRIEIDGDDVTGADLEILRRSIGYVQQDGGLLPHWSVRANVEFVPRLFGCPKEKIHARSTELLELIGLDPAIYGDRRPSELSGGQRQRVAFARAIAAKPKFLLLDEPFGALDPVLRAELQDEVARWQDDLHLTALLVTHDMAEAMKLGDRIVVLREGVVQQDGTPNELRDHPANDYVVALMRAAGVTS